MGGPDARSCRKAMRRPTPTQLKHVTAAPKTPIVWSQYVAGLVRVLALMRSDWDAMSARSAFVGQPGDAHQILLDVLGLHPASVEYHQRYAEGLDHLFNRAKLQHAGRALM